MFELTKQEKKVFLALALICLAGVTLHYAFQVNPDLTDMVNLIEGYSSPPKTDINKASYIQLIKVPYVGPLGAGRILLYRKRQGGFKNIRNLNEIEGINKKKIRIISKYLKVEHENTQAHF